MKFLGIHIGRHDSNFTYTDGTKVKYFKSERFKQIKHHTYMENPIEFFNDLKLFNIDVDTLDGVCIGEWFEQSKSEGKQFHKIDSIFKCQTYAISHHYAHSLSCFPLKNYQNIKTSFVLDGTGDPSGFGSKDPETLSVYDNNGKTIKKYRLPDTISIGRALRLLGKFWSISGHENDLAGKLMAFQSYGKLDQIVLNKYKHIDITKVDELFFNPPKLADENWLRNRHHICEQIVLDFFKDITSSDDVISYSGGVAQNILINSKLRDWNSNILIPPHSSDDGISLGCVELLRQIYQQDEFNTDGFPYWQQDEVKELPSKNTIKKAAEMIANGKIIGWCQGKGEIGPRALGNRSILMRADIENGKDILNNQVKHRESYRPFGCSVLLEDTNTYMDCDFESPYMLYGVNVKDNSLKSITHIDGTTRPQTVKDGIFAELLYEVKKLTGSSIILNTSLNVNGMPIANPDIAKTMKNGLDAVFVGDATNV
jgi:carbamoyltransferase